MPDATLVSKRCVFFIGDIDAAPPEAHYETFRQQLQRFAKTWGTRGSLTPFSRKPEEEIVSWRVTTRGTDWGVQTEYRYWVWSDTGSERHRSWTFRRTSLALAAFFDFVKSRTLWGYIRADLSFGTLFASPALLVLAGAVLVWWLAIVLGNLQVPYALALAAACIAIPTILLLRSRLRGLVSWTASLWVDLWKIVHLKNPDLAARLGVFSQDLIEILRRRDFDEVLVVGHGLGTTFLPIILDRAFWALPDYGKNGEKISLLTIAPSVLAVGLHPDASWMTGPLSRIARDRMVYWLELQSGDDILAFRGKHAVEVLTESKGRPEIKMILGETPDASSNRTVLEALLFRHHRLLDAQSKQSATDIYMMFCGPFDLKTFGRTPDRVLEPVSRRVTADSASP